MKLEWMAQHWAEDDAKKASDWMTELVRGLFHVAAHTK